MADQNTDQNTDQNADQYADQYADADADLVLAFAKALPVAQTHGTTHPELLKQATVVMRSMVDEVDNGADSIKLLQAARIARLFAEHCEWCA